MKYYLKTENNCLKTQTKHPHRVLYPFFHIQQTYQRHTKIDIKNDITTC